MASYYRLVQSSEREPIINLFDAINYAQHVREMEIRSATKIQSIVKMRQQRSTFHRVVKAVISVQRIFKGYQARKQTLESLIGRDERRQMQIFHYFATLIQSRFRGYISRKKGYDYHRQRRYIEGVVAKSEEVRHEAKEALQRQLVEMSEKADKDRREAFEKSLVNKHHLLSTATVSGVYRPQLTVEGYGTVFGTNVEDELRVKASQSYTSGATSARKFKRDLPTTMVHTQPDGTPSAGASPDVKASSAGPSTTRGGAMMAAATKAVSSVAGTYWGKGVLATKPPQSLQSSTPYDVVAQQESHEKALNKAIMERMHGKGGFNVRKTDAPKFDGTIASETPFVGQNIVASRKTQRQ